MSHPSCWFRNGRSATHGHPNASQRKAGTNGADRHLDRRPRGMAFPTLWRDPKPRPFPLLWLADGATTAYGSPSLGRASPADHYDCRLLRIDRASTAVQLHRRKVIHGHLLTWPSPGLLQDNRPTARCLFCSTRALMQLV